MYADRPQYRQYQRMLVELHAMIAAGNGNSDEAMDLRERMDGPEAQLSEWEMSRLNALSGDLSMIHDREIPDPEVVARLGVANVPLLLERAYGSNDSEQVLELLRTDVSSFLKALWIGSNRPFPKKPRPRSAPPGAPAWACSRSI